jgi:hypothetical protein
MRRSRCAGLFGVCVPFLALSASAHHSVAFYSIEKIELAGEITRIDWRNPHIQFGFSELRADGTRKDWHLESSSIFLREKDGVTRALFRVGDEVRIAGRPSAHDDAALLVTNMLLPDGREAPLWPNTSARFVTADKWISAKPEIVDAATENRGIFRVWRPNEVSLAGLPYTEAAVAGRKSFDLLAAASRCGPEGMPRIMMTLFPYEFVDRGDKILARTELYDTERTIHMDGKAAPPTEAPSVHGYSVGAWRDGDLVVETTLIDWPYFDQIGTPMTDRVSVTERYRLSRDQTRLDVELTVVDPFTFTEPAVIKNTWLAYGDEIARYDCRE